MHVLIQLIFIIYFINMLILISIYQTYHVTERKGFKKTVKSLLIMLNCLNLKALAYLLCKLTKAALAN
jgi:hypothetical protein